MEQFIWQINNLIALRDAELKAIQDRGQTLDNPLDIDSITIAFYYNMQIHIYRLLCNKLYQ